MRILARPPVMASKQALRVLARAAQAHMAARASSQVAKNKQPKSNLFVALTYGICRLRRLVLQRAVIMYHSLEYLWIIYIYHLILTRQCAIDGGQKDGEQQARGGCLIVDNQIRDYRGSQGQTGATPTAEHVQQAARII